jgi:hypothetical protein
MATTTRPHLQAWTPHTTPGTPDLSFVLSSIGVAVHWRSVYTYEPCLTPKAATATTTRRPELRFELDCGCAVKQSIATRPSTSCSDFVHGRSISIARYLRKLHSFHTELLVLFRNIADIEPLQRDALTALDALRRGPAVYGVTASRAG